MFALKSLGCWRSSNVAEGYIEESEYQEIEIAKTIMKPAASTSSSSLKSIEVTYQNSMVKPIFHNSVQLTKLEAECHTCRVLNKGFL